MNIRPGLRVDDVVLAAFAGRYGVRHLSLFGSVLRDDFGPGSDIDVLVEFYPRPDAGAAASLGDGAGARIGPRSPRRSA